MLLFGGELDELDEVDEVDGVDEVVEVDEVDGVYEAWLFMSTANCIGSQ